MHVQIQVKGLPESSKLRRLASHKLDAALARFAHVVRGASMQLDDINGPNRGGVDKLCRVVLRLRNDSVLVIEELGADIAEAINRAAERLQQNVARQLAHLVKKDRSGLRQNMALLSAA